MRFIGLKPPGPVLARLMGDVKPEGLGEWRQQLSAAFPDPATLRDELPGLPSKAELLETLKVLARDPHWLAFAKVVFDSEELRESLEDDAAEAYDRMSAGQRALVNIFAPICRDINRNVLVIVDEPENHLHSSLLSGFVKQLNSLLHNANAFAIMATHSPIILQETPARFVTFLDRTGNQTSTRRPGFETFGASLEAITADLFQTDFTTSRWKEVLHELASRGLSVEEAEKLIGNQPLSPLARSYLAYHVARRNQ